MKKIRNSTSIDEAGVRLNLIRGLEEDLNDYYVRLYKCVKEDEKLHKYSFRNSLGYVTSSQEKILAKITLNESLPAVLAPRISINDEKLIIDSGDDILINEKLSDYKFVKYFLEDIQSVDGIDIEYLEAYEDIKYLKAENIMPLESERTRVKYKTQGYVSTLPNKYVMSVQDEAGNFLYESEDAEYIVDEEFYNLNENVITKFSNIEEDILYTYLDFPLYIKWSEFKSYEIFQESFNSVTHEEDGKLKQEGAKIYNKILEKHNTYWGK